MHCNEPGALPSYSLFQITPKTVLQLDSVGLVWKPFEVIPISYMMHVDMIHDRYTHSFALTAYGWYVLFCGVCGTMV